MPRFSFFLDSVETARAVVAAAPPATGPFNVWIEIDSGEHRTGLDPDDPALIEIAAILRDGGVAAGRRRHPWRPFLWRAHRGEMLAAIAEQERAAVVTAAERLRAAGFEVPGVSAGSTPTATPYGVGRTGSPRFAPASTPPATCSRPASARRARTTSPCRCWPASSAATRRAAGS